MTQRPIILCDVMETLVTEPFFAVAPSFFGLTLRELLAAKHPTSWIEFEQGRISEDEYFARFFRDGRAADGVGLRQRIQEAYRWVEGMETLLAELHATGCEVHALSNYSLWYQCIEESLALSRYLRWTFVSCLTGVRKPDPQAYLGAVAQLQVEPSSCLFIDDRPENVDAARAVSMDAILMRDAAQIRAEMVARGILAS